MQMCNMNRVGIYEKAFPASLSWDERLLEAGKAGYDFVEMSLDTSEERLSRLEWSQNTRSALCRSMENVGIPILTMGVSGHRKYPLGSASSRIRQRGLDILKRSIDLAYDLGVRVIQLMGYDVFYEDSDAGTRERFLDGLKQGVCWASAADMMLSLENVDVETVDSVEKALHFIREVNSPWMNLYPDIGNMVAAGYDSVEQLKLGKDYLVGIHLKDALPGKVRGVPFEHGNVPLYEVFRTLVEINFSGPLVVEMWADLDTSGDSTRAAAEANRLVQRYLHASRGDSP